MMTLQHIPHIASLGLWLGLAAWLGLVLDGCSDRATPDRPHLLHREQAMVGTADWVRLSGNTPQAAGSQIGGSMTIRAVACRRPDTTGERPKLVIHEPVCESFVWPGADAGRID